MESYLYFGKKKKFKFFEKNDSLFPTARLTAMVELDEACISILPKSRIYGLHFVKEGPSIYASFSIYEYSLDKKGRPGYHAFSFFYPFQVGSKRYNYFPQNLGETMWRGLERTRQLKETGASNILQADIKFDELKTTPSPIISTEEITVIEEPIGSAEDFFRNILLADSPTLSAKYFGTDSKVIIAKSSYLKTGLPPSKAKICTGIDYSIGEIWHKHESGKIKAISGKFPKISRETSSQTTDQNSDKSVSKLPYFITSWKHDNWKKGIIRKGTTGKKGEPNYFNNKRHKEKFARFLEAAKKKGESEYLIYLTREGTPKNTIFIAFGKLTRVSNFFCIEHPIEKAGVIAVPDVESFLTFIKKVISQMDGRELDEMPDFRTALRDIKVCQFTAIKTKWYHFPVRHNIGEGARFIIGKKPEDLKSLFQYFFLDSKLETWEINYVALYDGKSYAERGKIRRKIKEDFKASKTNISYLDYLNGTTSGVKTQKHFAGDKVDLDIERKTAKEGQNINPQGKRKNKFWDSFFRDWFLEDKFTVLIYIAVAAFLVLLIYLKINFNKENTSAQTPKIEATIQAPTQKEVEEQIKGLSLGDVQRKIILESTNYLSKIGKTSRYKIHFKDEKGAKADLFPAGYSNKIYPWKRADMDKHKGNLRIILTALEGREGIPEATLGQLQKIIDGLQAHQDQYFPKGFDRTKYEFKTISIDKAKSTVTLFQLGQDYGIPWKLLVEFNPGNIKLNGNHDEKGNPDADFNWEGSKATKLIAYVPRNKFLNH